MRRLLLSIAVAAIALAATACTSAAPGWTYAPSTPAPAVTPAPSGEASAAPTAAASSDGSAIAVSALNIAFEQTEIKAPADTKFTIAFDNKDAGIPHNVAIHDSMSMEKFKGDLVTGPGTITYTVDPLPAGDYTFVCSVHPNMKGTLKVGG